MLLSVETTDQLCIKFIFFQCYDTMNWLLQFFQPVTLKPQTLEQKILTETEHSSYNQEKSKVFIAQTLFNSFLFLPPKGSNFEFSPQERTSGINNDKTGFFFTLQHATSTNKSKTFLLLLFTA